MRANILLLAIIATFFFASSAVYTLWHMVSYDGEVEWTGTIGMALTGILSVLIGFYLWLLYRNQAGELPEDRLDAEIDDADPEMGHFSPWSWWPIALGAALAMMFVSLAGPTFLIPIAAALTLIMLVGWVYEYYRGNFSR
ncbi:cytochrome c oxidase subunit 4 [Agrococcus terreus]|uniref:Cytochrome c oxidase polypeptide 4 n=1 Tax=Agrococcus terreus TaxID=574649 RepID=A0ABQ2KNS1_9MICO|nr:cytochrome c oxidase subunit 4 [Agrococcus terreus]GGN85459.1 putative cytochrome c oxidase polypeptide 4 [Agrococcus terreus]